MIQRSQPEGAHFHSAAAETVFVPGSFPNSLSGRCIDVAAKEKFEIRNRERFNFCVPTAREERYAALLAITDDLSAWIETIDVRQLANVLIDRIFEAHPKYRRLESIEKSINIIFQRYGIGSPAKTLQQLANELGVTRERVRQLEERGLKRSHQADLDLTDALTRCIQAINLSDGIILASEAPPHASIWGLLRLQLLLKPALPIVITDDFILVKPWESAKLEACIDSLNQLYWTAGLEAVQNSIREVIPFDATTAQYKRVELRLLDWVRTRQPTFSIRMRDALAARVLREIGDTAHFTTIAKFCAHLEGRAYSKEYARNIHALLLRREDLFVRPGGRGMFSLPQLGARKTRGLRSELYDALKESDSWLSAKDAASRIHRSARFSEASILLTASFFPSDFLVSPNLSLLSVRDGRDRRFNEAAMDAVSRYLSLNQGASRQSIQQALEVCFSSSQIDTVLCFDSRIIGVGSSKNTRYVLLDHAISVESKFVSTKQFVEIIQREYDVKTQYEALAIIQLRFGWRPSAALIT